MKISYISGNLKPRGVEYNLEKLKKASKIRREGPTKGGIWIVLK